MNVIGQTTEGSRNGDEKETSELVSVPTENRGDEGETIGGVAYIILEANGADQPAGVMQESMVLMEGLQDDADVRTDQQTGSRVWIHFVLMGSRVTRTVIKDKCLLARRMKSQFVKHGPWTLKNPPKRAYECGKQYRLTQMALVCRFK